MKRYYLTPLVPVNDGSEALEPALDVVYKGTWGSDPGPTMDTLIVWADVTDEEHGAILAVNGVSEVE
jgi:hypothetical protein